jgi:hypothetical protein
MKSSLFILLFTACAWAQPQIQLALDPANPSPLAPGPVILNVQALNFPTPAPAAAQFSMTLPPTATLTTGALAGSLIGSTKTIECAAVPPVFDCIIAGLGNSDPIPPGPSLAKITLTLPAGTFSLALVKPFLVDPTGLGIPLTAGAPISISIPLSACDLNGDGVVNPLDVQIAINQSLGKDQGGNVVACTTADLNKDGSCNVLDVQRVNNAAVPGGVCKVGP